LKYNNCIVQEDILGVQKLTIIGFYYLIVTEVYAASTCALVWLLDTKTLSVCGSWFALETSSSCGHVRFQFILTQTKVEKQASRSGNALSNKFQVSKAQNKPTCFVLKEMELSGRRKGRNYQNRICGSTLWNSESTNVILVILFPKTLWELRETSEPQNSPSRGLAISLR